jgi:hypothetical protein
VPEQSGDRRAEVEVRAGFGIVGDRYAGKAAHRDASVTVIGVEPLETLAAELGVPPFDPLRTRRNVVLRGRGGIRCAPVTDGVLRLGPRC